MVRAVLFSMMEMCFLISGYNVYIYMKMNIHAHIYIYIYIYIY